MTALDKVDLGILKILQGDARITNQNLAEKIHLSPSSCLMRVRKLEEKGILQSYQAVINLKLICRMVQCVATISIHSQTKKDFELFENCVAEMPEVLECYTVSGQFDFFLRIVAANMERYLEITDELLECIDGEINLNTHVVMSENKRFSAYPLDRLV